MAGTAAAALCWGNPTPACSLPTRTESWGRGAGSCRAAEKPDTETQASPLHPWSQRPSHVGWGDQSSVALLTPSDSPKLAESVNCSLGAANLGRIQTVRRAILQFQCEDYFFHLEISLGIVVLITLCVPGVCLALLFIPSSQVIFILFLSLITWVQPGLPCYNFWKEESRILQRTVHKGECYSHAGQPRAPCPGDTGTPEPRADGSKTKRDSWCASELMNEIAPCELESLERKRSETSTGK